MEIMKWLNNINMMLKYKKSVECPYCNSYDTDYSTNTVIKDTKMGFADIWCNNCGRSVHISRICLDETNYMH